MSQDLPSPELMRKLLRYEHETGKLFWLFRTPDMFSNGSQTAEQRCALWNGRYGNKEALCSTDLGGYKHGRIFHRMVTAHRVIWAIYYGAWPTGNIDHINGNPADNRISNLRQVSHKENMRNQKRRSDNKSGAVGVSWRERDHKWRAYISDVSGAKHLGSFLSKDDAIAARAEAEKRLGYHENHGRPQ
jgi:hypothetical protein